VLTEAFARRFPGAGHVLGLAGFRRLLSVRLAGQFADGVFQASLAGTVLFNPEQQAHASDIAYGFAVLLLPYSVLGPFCGVLLDRWWRQRVLCYANLIRALLVCGVSVVIAFGVRGWLLYLSALVVISLNRFVLSALSACLPHVVEPGRLISANAISTTSGAIMGALGGSVAIGLRALTNGGNHGYALIAVGSGVAYLIAGLRARGFGTRQLGPDDEARHSSQSMGHIAAGLVDGARHIRAQRRVVIGLTMIGIHRFAYGVTAISLLLLYRNYFTDDGVLRAGLTGLGQVVAGIAIGGGLAAFATPYAVVRIGYVRWSSAMLIGAGLTEWGLGLPFKLQTILPAAALLGFVAQGVKICVDTMVAQSISDDYRGRVFTLYDTLFNVVFVAAGVLTAIALPENGKSAISVVLVGATYLILGIAYYSSSRRTPDAPTAGVTVVAAPKTTP
jgi:MFS family permease